MVDQHTGAVWGGYGRWRLTGLAAALASGTGWATPLAGGTGPVALWASPVQAAATSASDSASSTAPRAGTTPSPAGRFVSAPPTSSAPPVPVAAPAGSSATISIDAWSAAAREFGGVVWATRPSRDVAQGFTLSVEIVEVRVKPGDIVKKGDVLMRGRDGPIQARLVAQRLRSTNNSDVRAATSARDLAQIRFDAIVQAREENGANAAEFDERRVQLEQAKIAVEAANMKLQEEVLAVRQLEEELARYVLTAPFDGIADTVVGEVGQAATENSPVLRLVNIDPLWVDAPVRFEQTVRDNLKPGDAAWVLIDTPGEATILPGRVLSVSPVTDAVNQRRVRVEARNPGLLPAGTPARVRFQPVPTELERLIVKPKATAGPGSPGGEGVPGAGSGQEAGGAAGSKTEARRG